MATKLSSLKRKAAPKHSQEVKNPRKVQKVSKTQQIDTFPAEHEDDEVGAHTVKTTKISSKTVEALDVEEEDEQTAALLKGFESSSEGEEVSDYEDGEEESESAAGKPVPSLPKSKALKAQLAAAKASSSASEGPGVVYVGRIPHGFYEPQMRAYFSQFGEISRLRLSRNRRTGASKHYAFIEFASGEVASIVAKTMDNYLILNHLLKVKRLTREQVHPELFKGANKRFHKVPWRMIDRFRAHNVDRPGWGKRIEREQQRRDKKAAQMKALGYEFDAPSLRPVEDVPVQPNPAEHAAIEQAVDTNAHREAAAVIEQKAMPQIANEKVVAAAADAAAVVKKGASKRKR